MDAKLFVRERSVVIVQVTGGFEALSPRGGVR